MLASQLAAARLLSRSPEAVTTFWSLVERDEGPGGCWRWRGRFDSSGTPLLSVRAVALPARRVACFAVSGAYPLHTRAVVRCDEPRCVRPSHLEWRVGALRARAIARQSDGYVPLAPAYEAESEVPATGPARASRWCPSPR